MSHEGWPARAAVWSALRALAVLMVGIGVFAATDRGPQAPRPAFKAGVDVVSLTVTVTDPEGRLLTDLAREEFTVFEDGAPQTITFFSRHNLPIALSLLFDTSASMEDRLALAQEAALVFARRLRPEDLAQLLTFDRDVRIAQRFTNRPADLEAAIRRTAAGGSTALYTALYVALKELAKIRATTVDDVRRQAIVVLSDGDDTSSLVTYEQVLDLARRSETAIYAVGLRSKIEADSKVFRQADHVLKTLAQQTGGRAFFPTDPAELPRLYTKIADELASQYELGYTSTNTKRDGAWRVTAVRTTRQGAVLRTRLGYFGPKGPPSRRRPDHDSTMASAGRWW